MANTTITGLTNLSTVDSTSVFPVSSNGTGTYTTFKATIGNIAAAVLSNGNSNIRLTTNSNIAFSTAGNANILLVTGTGIIASGTGNITGNANVGNLGTAGIISATGNLTAGNVSTATLIATTIANVANLSANGNVIFSGANVSVGAVGNLKITGGSNLQYLQTDGTGNIKWNTLVNANNEFHVSVSGNDTTGNGSVINPFATIGQAVTTAGTNIHSVIVVHPGTYVENVAVTANSITITGTGQASDSARIQGNLTFSGNASFNYVDGLLIGNLLHSANGSLYVYNSIVGSTAFPGSVTKSGTGYLEMNNSDLQTGNLANGALTSMSVTGNGTVNLDGVHIYNLTVNNANAQVLINNSLNSANTTLTAGGLTIAGSFLYSFTNGGNALTATGGVLQINGSSALNPNLTLGKIAVGANVVYGYQNISFDKANSTLSGTSLSTIGDFQQIRADGMTAGNISVTANITGSNANFSGTLRGTTIQGTAITATSMLTSTLNANSAVSLSGNVTSTGNTVFSGANVSLGAVANLHITGGTNGQLLSTDGNGGISFSSTLGTSGNGFNVNGSTANINVSGSTVLQASQFSILLNVANVSTTGFANIGSNLNVTSTVTANTVQGNLITTTNPPASGSATGAIGQIAFDASFIYVAVGTNTWARAPLSLF